MSTLKKGELPSEEFQAEVARLGAELYERVVLPRVEAEHTGQFVAIHVDSGDYAVDRSTGRAARQLMKSHPTDGRIYMRRIGDEPEYGLAARLLASDQLAAARK